MTDTPRLSVVAPCYNEEAGLREFWRRASASARAAVGEAHEIVLVDDGSRDQTWTIIEALSAEDPRVVGVRLFRNHGHQLAASAGLAVARGERVMLIDADLQDPPELVGEMMRLMDAGADVVYGQRRAREGESAFKILTAAAFYRILARLTPVPIPRDTGDFRLMSRAVVDALSLMPERHRFIRGMVSWIGGRQTALTYDRDARFAGESKYPLKKMILFAIDAITSFSAAPLRFAAWLGGIVSLLAVALIVFTLVTWATGNVVPGWASSVIANAIFAGTQLFVLGIMGEYLGRLVEETKGRPLFLIGSVVQRGVAKTLPVEFSTLGGDRRRELLDASGR